MAKRMVQNNFNQFISALKDSDGVCGNKRLREKLDWDEKSYWKIQGHLLKEGKIVLGRGKGGSVRLVGDQATESTSMGPALAPTIDETMCGVTKERDLYSPLKASIQEKWIKRFAFDNVLVDETHSRGSKNTGGTFTRPDITAIGIRRYVYLPKRLEVITFEIKPDNEVNLMGALEAIAHREAAHRAYVIYATTRDGFDSATDGERIMELGQKYGIGIIVTENPSNVESWEIMIDAIRHEPDPARLERFIGDLPNDNMKKEISKWKS